MNQQTKEVAISSPNSKAVSTTREEKFGGVTTHQQAELAAISVATKERALIEGAYIMAKKFPRNEEDARARILRTCQSYSFADKAKYKKPVGNTTIVGPSIRLAEEMMRQWGHMRVEAVVLYDDIARRIVQVSALDLQTGANGIMQFTLEKTVERKNAVGREVIGERLNSYNEKISIVVATEDEVMVKQNAILSKYRRNLILQLIPTDILSDALARVDKTIKEGVAANPDAAKKAVMDNFGKLGILPSEIEKYIGHAIAQLTTDEIVELKEVFNAISDGEETWKNILAVKLNEGPTERPQPEKADAEMPTPQAEQGAPSETAWEQEDKEKKGFKAGDPSTHQKVNKPLNK